nr:C40 family peptidase [Mycolicibacterium sp. CBMA 361]
MVRQVEGALGRAHALFGDPPDAAGVAALGASNNLAEAGGGVRAGQVKMAGLSGAMPQSYHNFATDAAPALDAAAGSDQKLSDQLHDAARSDRTGRSTSGDVLTGASSDTNAIAPTTGTPAGKIALVRALRARIAQQDEVVKAYQARDARLAAMLRSTMNGRGRRGGGMPMGSMPFGGLGGGSGSGGGGSMLGSGMSGLSGLSSLGGGGRDPRTMLASNVDFGDHNAANVPGEPGQGAVKAALSKLGRPYVWGAKGPSVFDCSGLTQWAWGQAGVRIGGDTYSQIKDGVAVPAGQVRAGDLIFPTQYFGEGGKSGPGHVMLAINDHECVHAPQPGDVVKIAPMPKGFVARRPVRLTAA